MNEMLPARTAFLSAGGGQLRLRHIDVKHVSNNGTVLHVTGYHADDTPFAIVTAPFEGDVIQRAREIASDLIRVHHGTSRMPAPAQIKSLAATLRDRLARASQAASDLGMTADTAVTELEKVISDGHAVVNDVKAATAEVQAALGLSTNGGPTGPLPGEA